VGSLDDGAIEAALLVAATLALIAIASAALLLHRGTSSDAASAVLRASVATGLVAVAIAAALTAWIQSR